MHLTGDATGVMLMMVTESTEPEAPMHPWITGRIIDTMQHDARARAEQQRLGEVARHARARAAPTRAATPLPRRERLGLAVARVGLRLAGPDGARRGVRAALTTPDATWTSPWTTCGATSTSAR